MASVDDELRDWNQQHEHEKEREGGGEDEPGAAAAEAEESGEESARKERRKKLRSLLLRLGIMFFTFLCGISMITNVCSILRALPYSSSLPSNVSIFISNHWPHANNALLLLLLRELTSYRSLIDAADLMNSKLLLMLLQGGIYVLNLVDASISGFPMLLVGLLECVVFQWVYGMRVLLLILLLLLIVLINFGRRQPLPALPSVLRCQISQFSPASTRPPHANPHANPHGDTFIRTRSMCSLRPHSHIYEYIVLQYSRSLDEHYCKSHPSCIAQGSQTSQCTVHTSETGQCDAVASAVCSPTRAPPMSRQHVATTRRDDQ